MPPAAPAAVPLKPAVPMLVAPTAAGKTALALELAELLATEGITLEIVAADAFTVYRGLDIGTAKPTPAEQAQVRHHLLNVVDVTEDFDVAQYVALAETAIREVLARGNVPLVVGGTGFYLSALRRGLPLTPPSVPAEREALEAELQEHGLEVLLEEIRRANPAELTRMERNPRRVVRALEVYRRTGKFPGEFGYQAPAYAYAVTAFSRPPAELETRLRQRLSAMFAAGWAEEAGWLAGQVPPATQPRPTAWQALGYREALAVARGELGQAAAEERIFVASRQYAKRQLTWMRSQLGADVVTPEQARKHTGEQIRRVKS